MRWFVSVVLMAMVLLARGGDARACGAFVGPAAALPYLAEEQVVLLWDRDTQSEDFIREARFERANANFGFIVPTPTRPEVSAVKDAPFARLREAFPLENMPVGVGNGIGGGAGGSSSKGAPPAVTVLAKQRIGSFTAFTLAATDAGAFGKWLSDNGFTATPESKPWVEHYVKLKFFFVAFRYDAKAGDAGMTSETVRLHFQTPNPYYPYFEPAHAAGGGGGGGTEHPRELTGWILGREVMEAVAARPDDHPRWGRPWKFGDMQAVPAARVAEVLGKELAGLVPKADQIVVQPFRDSKVSRAHWGDVVLVPAAAQTFSPADREARRPLLGVLDPTIIGEAKDEDEAPPTPLELAPAIPAADAGAVPPAEESKGCATASGPSNSNPTWIFVAVIGACLARRRRALIACSLFAIGCGDKTKPAPAPVASAKPFVPTVTTDQAREDQAFDILAGRLPKGGLPVDSARLGDTRAMDIGIGNINYAVAPGIDAMPALEAARPRIRACYETALRGDATQAGTVTVTFAVMPGGEVRRTNSKTDGTVRDNLAACVSGIVAHTQFPAEARSEDLVATVKLRLSQD